MGKLSNISLSLSLLLGSSAFAADSSLSISAGAEHSSGDYGTNRTVEEIYIPLKLNYTSGSIGYALTLPYLSVRAPTGTIITNSQGQVIIGEGPKATESGMGDVIAGITFYDLYVSQSRDLFVDATAKVKFGTADEDKGLGTGKTDYSGQINVYQYFDDISASAIVGYKVRGDPSDFDLDNVWFGSIGLKYRVNSATRTGIVFDYRQSSFDGADPVREISVFVSHRLDNNWRIQLYALSGFSDNSPDLAAGLLVKYYL